VQIKVAEKVFVRSILPILTTRVTLKITIHKNTIYKSQISHRTQYPRVPTSIIFSGFALSY